MKRSRKPLNAARHECKATGGSGDVRNTIHFVACCGTLNAPFQQCHNLKRLLRGDRWRCIAENRFAHGAVVIAVIACGRVHGIAFSIATFDMQVPSAFVDTPVRLARNTTCAQRGFLRIKAMLEEAGAGAVRRETQAICRHQ